MNEEEARTALKARGYSIHLRQRRERLFVYAARRMDGKLTERYLAPLASPDLLVCIEALPNMNGSAPGDEPQKLGNVPAHQHRSVGQRPDQGESEEPGRCQVQAHDPEQCHCLACRSSRGYKHISQQEQYDCELAALARSIPNFAEIWYKAAIEGRLTGYTPPEKIIWPEAGAIYTHLAGGNVLRGLELAQEIRVQVPLHSSKWSPSPLELLLWSVRPGDMPTTHPALARFLELLQPYLPPDLQNVEALPNNTPGIAQRKQGSGTLRARFKAIGKRLAYREVWFDLEDVYHPGASRLPAGQEHWNEWADATDEWMLETVIVALEQRYPAQPPGGEKAGAHE